MRLLDERLCLAAAREHADIVVGIKVRVGRNASGWSGVAPLDMALEAAEHAGLPVMAHLDHPPPYAHRGDAAAARRRHPDALLPPVPEHAGEAGRADPRRRAGGAATRRDLRHRPWRGSFGFETSMAMLKQGFLPDVISSDVHAVCIDGPAYNLLVTMSKFLTLGVPLTEVVRATTINAARAIGRPDRGMLVPGLLGDATVLEVETGTFDFRDVLNQTMKGTERLACRGVVLGGKWWTDGRAEFAP